MPTESTLPYIKGEFPDIWKMLMEDKRDYPETKVIYRDSDTDRTHTYAEVKNAAIQFGEALKSNWEWKKGDVLGLYTPNSIDSPIVIMGTLWAGGIVCPANSGYLVDELAHQLKDCRAKALVTQKPQLSIALEAARKVGIPEDRIILIGDEKDETLKFRHFTSFRNISGTSRYRRAKINPTEDLAFLVYSSGTTGLPKGVMLSHSNITANLHQLAIGDAGQLSWRTNNGEGDRLLSFLPFYHIYGLTCLVQSALHNGIEVVVMTKFDMERFCYLIQKHKITFLYLVPPTILRLAKDAIVSKYDISSVRMINSGAAPLTHELVNSFYDRHHIPIKQGYGLSEMSPTTHMQAWDDCMDNIGAVGRLVSNQTAKYMSPEEKEVPAGEVGELWIKGPNVFKGYLNNPEGTKNAFSEDGYFKTGDVGYQDKKGNFYITDRIKELIKYKGFQVAPAEIEGLLVTHPAIDDVGVIGVYSKDHATELPRAYVVPKKGVTASKELEKTIVDYVAEKLAAHKRLRGGVIFLDEIPKSPSGKILRRVLKEWAEAEEKKKGVKAKL